ncbi:MAG: decarboxylase [Thermoleophilia bacterium]|nr:decarboxylase [Thermoleophilia bacterium]
MSSQAAMPLVDALRAFLADPTVAPFTTPGHKRAPWLADALLATDAPLAAGADDLHLSLDLLGSAERLAAGLWGADWCRFCVNGSTQGNQALALAAGGPGDRVVVCRNLHKSLLAGLVLAGLDPVWVHPAIDRATGLALGVPAEAVATALREHPDARAVFLVEPSFVGVISDVGAIAEICTGAGVPLVVDQAWGAYLGFHPVLPPHALALGADAFVTSAHKTLTGFTQSAYLLARAGRLDLDRLREGFDALTTTSPSAGMLASLDRTRALLAARGEELLGRALALVARARSQLAAIGGLRVLGADSGWAYDPLKLVLSLSGTGADGIEVERDLWASGVRVELANRDTIVPLVTIGDDEESVERLVSALAGSLERRRGEPRPAGGASAVWSVEPEAAISPRAAFFAPRETVSAAAAAGRIAAEAVAPYPPGIPAIAPGEVITASLLAALAEAAATGTRLAYCADPSLATIRVVAR